MKTCAIGVVALCVGLVLAVAVFAVPVPPNIPVSGPQPGLQNEEQVWICPQNTDIVITNHRDFRLGYRQIGLGRSIDGGASWVDTLISPEYQVFTHQSDPIMTVNSSGDIFLCHLDYRGGIPVYDSSYIAFLVSNDCGETWQGPYTVEDTIGPYFEDKQFMTCDRTGGAHDGSIYISWSRFGNPTRIMLARSTTNAVSFEDTVIVGNKHYVSCFDRTFDAGQFSQPLVGKDGAVYVFWVGTEFDTLGGNCGASGAIRMNKSTDGGVTFEGERVVCPAEGWGSVVDGGIDVYCQPTTDADITNGPHAGNLYLQYRDSVGPPFYESDIFFRRSLDTGHTWSEPMRVNDDPIGPDVDQFHNWMVCNNEGVLVSVWYDQRLDPAHYKFDVFAGYSYDGGATWTSNHRVSSVSSSPSFLVTADAAAPRDIMTPVTPLEIQSPQAGLIAEYIGVSCIDDNVVAVWTDTRDATGPGEQDVYSAHWNLPLTEPRLISPVNGDAIADARHMNLTWATAWKENEDAYRVQVAWDDAFNSVFIDSTIDSNLFNDTTKCLECGDYYWRVKAYKKGPTTFVDSTEFSSPAHLLASICDVCAGCPFQADFDADGFLTSLDLSELIDILFAGHPDITDVGCPTSRSDFDNDGFPTALDLGALIDHLFAGGPGPCQPYNPVQESCAP